MRIYAGEINDWNINKGKAISRVCEYLQEDIKNTIAFGDSLNDLEMIVAAGIGIAMGNAEAALKEKADLICESVMEDGVARELKRLELT